MDYKLVSNVALRYFLIILFGIGNLFLIYSIFKPLTVFSVFFIFDVFFKAELINNFILVKGVSIELINACVAGSAYYLLLILNLSVPKTKKHLRGIAFSFSLFFLINIFRIFILGIIAIYFSKAFFLVHQLTWYILSIVIVVLIWFYEVYLFKIKEIPFYSDYVRIKNSLKETKCPKRNKKHN